MLRFLPAILLALGPAVAGAQYRPAQPALAGEHYKSGGSTLEAFAPVAAATRGSMVSFDLDGQRVALGMAVSGDGLVLTKASEITPGVLTARLADGTVAAARILAVAEESDVALVQIESAGLKPVAWSDATTEVGQWAVTPGLAFLPEAVGIVSVPPRRILHRRALIGVQLDLRSDAGARISRVMDGYGAARAGLQSGDVILSVNASAVGSGDDLMGLLREFRTGQTVLLRVQRGEEEFEVDVPMQDAEPENAPGGSGRQSRLNRMGGQVSARAEGFAQAIQHDTVLEPWQCGGPLMDLDGRVIGLNIARAGRIASYALPAGLVRELLLQLRADAGLTDDRPR